MGSLLEGWGEQWLPDRQGLRLSLEGAWLLLLETQEVVLVPVLR